VYQQDGASCTDTGLLITSHRNQQLEDRDGGAGLNGDTGSWQEWTIKKSTGSKFYITSHRNQQLEDRDGNVGLHGDKGSWQEWTIEKLDNTKFLITSHRNQQLEDRDGRVGMNGDNAAWQQWTIVSTEGLSPFYTAICEYATISSRSPRPSKALVKEQVRRPVTGAATRSAVV